MSETELSQPRFQPGATSAASAPPSTVAATRSLLSGGTEGNRRLTGQTGAILLVLFALLGVTILRIGQLLSVHMFVGVLLLGPVGLKLASTGYRFTRYYTSDRDYVRIGPPPTLLRMLAPLLILTTVGVFATGLVLLFGGPAERATFEPLHKYFFFAWLAVIAAHVLGHLAELPSALGGRRRSALANSAQKYSEAIESIPGMSRPVVVSEPAWDGYGTGKAGRALAVSGALLGGLVLALVSISWFGSWHGF
jgi:hypothetical protein